jgi:hypothetical protein
MIFERDLRALPERQEDNDRRARPQAVDRAVAAGDDRHPAPSIASTRQSNFKERLNKGLEQGWEA